MSGSSRSAPRDTRCRISSADCFVARRAAAREVFSAGSLAAGEVEVEATEGEALLQTEGQRQVLNPLQKPRSTRSRVCSTERVLNIGYWAVFKPASTPPYPLVNTESRKAGWTNRLRFQAQHFLAK